MPFPLRVIKGDALLIMDLQNDFCPGGSLPCANGDRIVLGINRILNLFPYVFATRDSHPESHVSFAEQGGPWPTHCVEGTYGAELHTGLKYEAIDEIFQKGQDSQIDAYSVLEGLGFLERLKKEKIKRVFVCGLAIEYCIRATVLDLIKAGFKTYVLVNLCGSVEATPGDGERALREMEKKGAVLLESKMLVVEEEKHSKTRKPSIAGRSSHLR